jgi:cell division protein FtsI/penicillin-binding protein 2
MRRASAKKISRSGQEEDAAVRDRWSRPELVVVVHLRYGDGGKETAPLAAEVIRKWREIQKNCIK